VNTEAIRMSNPLSEDRSVLRTSLVPGLLANLAHAQKRQVKRCALFELSRIFEARPQQPLPHERYMLALVLCGPRKLWIGDEDEYDFYDGKGLLQAIIRAVCGSVPETRLDDTLDQTAPYLHPKRRASLYLDTQQIGCLGEIHPDIADAMKLSGRPVVASTNVEAIIEAIEALGVKQVMPLPRYPSATRDLAVVVAESVPAGEVTAVLQKAADGLAEEVALFDIYRGTPVSEGYKSMAFRVVYRDPEATLTDNRVEKVHSKVVKAAEQRFHAMVRTSP
jgi:phenylalanyl-tRNA synthetase beta chain